MSDVAKIRALNDVAHNGAFAPAFDDLRIGAATGHLLAKIHCAKPRERLVRGPHKIRYRPQKVNEILRRRCSTPSQNPRYRFNDINNLRLVPRRIR